MLGEALRQPLKNSLSTASFWRHHMLGCGLEEFHCKQPSSRLAQQGWLDQPCLCKQLLHSYADRSLRRLLPTLAKMGTLAVWCSWFLGKSKIKKMGER